MASASEVLSEIRNPLLTNDLMKIGEVYARTFPLLDKILRYEADAREVSEWYLAQDPLHEDLDLAALHSFKTGDSLPTQIALSHKFYEVVAMEQGAAILVAGIDAPSAERPGATHWYQNISAVINNDEPGRLASSDEIICSKLLELGDKQLTETEINSLLMAAEMLIFASSSSLRTGVGSIEQEDGVTIGLHPDGAYYDRVMAHSILNRVAEKISDPNTPRGRATILEAAAMRFAICIVDSELSSGNKDERCELKDKFILEYIDILQDQLTGKNKLQDEMSKGTVKGLIHEHVWLLDVQIIKRTNNSDFNILPSLAYHDRPVINKPKMNRAFDFMFTNDRNQLAVQIKSSRSRLDRSDYHPKIKLFAEDNFQDNNERRLTAKLNAYRRLVESGYSVEQRSAAEKYILPTAIEAVAAFRETCLPRNMNNELGAMATRYGTSLQPALNREQRRKMHTKKSKKLF